MASSSANYANCPEKDHNLSQIKYEFPRKNIAEKSFSGTNLSEVESLRNTQLFIVQSKPDADFLHPNLRHEIFNEQRHLLFKGLSKLQLLRRKRKQNQKITILNLSKRKIVGIDFLDDKLTGSCNEAVISCPPGSPVARVTKYGGKYDEAPSYEITDLTSANRSIFSVVHSPNTSGSFQIEYSILKGGREKVAQITSKSGLNFMLHIKGTLTSLDKALLLGFIIAMDVFKQGKTARKTNDYEYN